MANRYDHLFNTDMTSIEARYKLYCEADKLQTREEKEELFKAYIPVVEAIRERETDRALSQL